MTFGDMREAIDHLAGLVPWVVVLLAAILLVSLVRLFRRR